MGCAASVPQHPAYRRWYAAASHSNARPPRATPATLLIPAGRIPCAPCWQDGAAGTAGTPSRIRRTLVNLRMDTTSIKELFISVVDGSTFVLVLIVSVIYACASRANRVCAVSLLCVLLRPAVLAHIPSPFISLLSYQLFPLSSCLQSILSSHVQDGSVSRARVFSWRCT